MTYSIVARDPDTGQLGVAVQSHYFACGAVVPWAQSGVGAVATQAIPEVGYGPRGLLAMQRGQRAEDALAELLRHDAMASVRQVAFVDAHGGVAAHTGTACVGAAGQRTGPGVSAQANMVAGPSVWEAMLDAYDGCDGPDLAARLLAALAAAEAAGGDLRGSQAAALVVVDGHAGGEAWDGRVVDVRVDDHPAPVAEVARLIEVQRATSEMNAALLGGPLLTPDPEPQAIDDALRALARAQEALLDNCEPSFWSAVLAARGDRIEEARQHLARSVSHRPEWTTFLARVADAGFLTDGQARALLVSP